MKKLNRRDSKESQLMDPDFVEALHESESRNSSQRQAERKSRQFCRQVQRALNLALADHPNNLFVDEVSPAPDCGRLLVSVVIPPDIPVANAIAELAQEAPRLRSEVAAAVSRKRAPELCFVPACPDGGADE